MEPRTHLAIHPDWVGEAVELAEGACRARLETRPEMAADDRGLVHGGFTFGLADYAVMMAVNHPNVVLGAAEVRFTAPVRVGEVMEARARVVEADGKRRKVRVEVEAAGRRVLEGILTAFVLERHVLEGD
ncbi:MAG: PaaI family thioesterase [Deltaproteobacteria bacterium]|nr:PaaI family thioesterase [Deltaproteobacteria bacterium]